MNTNELLNKVEDMLMQSRRMSELGFERVRSWWLGKARGTIDTLHMVGLIDATVYTGWLTKIDRETGVPISVIKTENGVDNP